MRFAHALLPRKGAWSCVTAGFAPPPHLRPPARASSDELDRYSMHYVISGRAPYKDYQGRRRELAAGDFFEFVPPRSHQYPRGSDDFLECVLILDARTTEKCRELGLLPFERPVGRAGLDRRLVEAFEDLVVRMESETPEMSRDWPLAQALEWVDRLYRADAAGRGRGPGSLVERACRMLAEDVHGEMKLEDVAGELGVDYDTFRKHFTGAMGQPPGRFRLAKRMDRACVMLYGGADVQDVAAELGYSDPFAFSRQFKRHTGLPPSHFRRRYAPKTKISDTDEGR
jgi:AraC-like DNA-binding protein